MSVSSKWIEEAVDQMATLPGVGRKTALRYVLSMLKKSPDEINRFAEAITALHTEVQYCSECYNIADGEKCAICSNPRRDRSKLCVVEDMRDIMALEATQQYSGLYHVLGGIISPMDGIGPSDLNIESLVTRAQSEQVKEIIFALSATLEGDTTNFYLYRKLQAIPLQISTLARGVAVGDSLEFADEVTLGRSILHRTPYESATH